MTLSCIIIDDEMHAIGELRDFIAENPQLILKESFNDVLGAVEYLKNEGNVDIIFSDINMPKINGLQAAKILNPYCRFLVYVTAHRNHALQAFEEKAAGYLVKPIDSQQLSELVNSFLVKDRVFLSTNVVQSQGVIFVKGESKNNFVKISLNDIKYIQAELNYSKICLTTGNQITYMLLGEFEKKLKATNLFFRINKSIIISIDNFKHIDGNNVFLTTGECFTIGVSYRAALLNFVKKRSLNF